MTFSTVSGRRGDVEKAKPMNELIADLALTLSYGGEGTLERQNV
jgi:hypothetical protein